MNWLWDWFKEVTEQDSIEILKHRQTQDWTFVVSWDVISTVYEWEEIYTNLIPWTWLNFEDSKLRISLKTLEEVDRIAFWEQNELQKELTENFRCLILNLTFLLKEDWKRLYEERAFILKHLRYNDCLSQDFRRAYEWLVIVKQIITCFKKFKIDKKIAVEHFRREMKEEPKRRNFLWALLRSISKWIID